MAAVVLLREFAFAGRTETPLIALLLLSASSAAAYLTVLLAMGSPVIGESAEIAGWILHRRSADNSLLELPSSRPNHGTAAARIPRATPAHDWLVSA